jgi:hypothetical protein
MASPSQAPNGAPTATPTTWNLILRAIEQGIDPHSFSTWFAPSRQLGDENGKLIVAVPTAVHARRLEIHFSDVVKNALRAIEKPELHIEFLVENSEKTTNGAPATEPAKTLKPLQPVAAPVFPEKAWYGLSKEYLALVGPRTEASPNYHLAAFLTAVGASLGRRVYLERSGRLHPNLFVVLVGRSGGGRKGTAVGFGTQLAYGIDPKLGFVNGLDSREGFLEHLGEIGKKQSHGSMSAIVHLSELRSLIEKTQVQGQGGIVPLLCDAYDAPDELAIHTRKNPISISKPVVSMLAATTTMWMEGLTDKDLHGGLGNRICWIFGQPGSPIAHPPALDGKRWRKLLAQLKRKLHHWHTDKATPFSLSMEAAEHWTKIYSSLYTRGLGDDPLISVLSERMQNHCLKAALVWAALDGTSVISMPHLEAGFAFAEFLYDNLWKLFRGFGASPMAKLDQKIIEAVKEAGPGGIRQRYLKKRFWRTDAELFNKRLYYLTMNDGPLLSVKDGQKILIFSADDEASAD